MAPPDVWGSGEICAYYQISRAALKKWRASLNFPQPRELQCGNIWDPAEIKAWHTDRGGYPYCTIALKRRRAGDSLRTIADRLEIGHETVRRMLMFVNGDTRKRVPSQGHGVIPTRPQRAAPEPPPPTPGELRASRLAP